MHLRKQEHFLSQKECPSLILVIGQHFLSNPLQNVCLSVFYITTSDGVSNVIVLSRVQAFLPQLEASNALLSQRAQEDPDSINIEHIPEGMEQYIEMVHSTPYLINHCNFILHRISVSVFLRIVRCPRPVQQKLPRCPHRRARLTPTIMNKHKMIVQMPIQTSPLKLSLPLSPLGLSSLFLNVLATRVLQR